MGEMGKIDLANSGTISKFMSKYGMNCIDIGPPVLGMHSPMEVTSKADVYAAYELYKAFYKDAGQPEF
jgi:aspartyl aminopeptidase